MMETIAWVGFSQSIFAAILIGSKKENSIADKILTAWLSLLGIEFFTCALDYRIFGRPLLSSSFLLINPAFFLYVKSLIVKDFRLKWIQLLHLAPYLIFETIAYIVHEPFSLESFFQSRFFHWYGLLFSFVTLISWLSYNSTSGALMIRHRKRLFNEFSNIESNKKITWIFFIVIFYNLYCLTVVILALIVFFLKVDLLLPHVFNYSALLALVYILGFYGLRQQTISQYTENEVHETQITHSLNIPADRRKTIIADLLDYFAKEKPFLNPDLNMMMLSGHLNVPKHQLTEVMNADLGKNFFHFVNGYRVESVKKMLSDPSNRFSIEAIGYDCGFSSKSSFFTVFKKLTGKTPQEYRNSVSASQGFTARQNSPEVRP
jgi:AraC-like DNA-binding protein